MEATFFTPLLSSHSPNSHSEVVHEAFPASWSFEKIVNLRLHWQVGMWVPRPGDTEAIPGRRREGRLFVEGPRGGRAGQGWLLEQRVGGGQAGRGWQVAGWGIDVRFGGVQWHTRVLTRPVELGKANNLWPHVDEGAGKPRWSTRQFRSLEHRGKEEAVQSLKIGSAGKRGKEPCL